MAAPVQSSRFWTTGGAGDGSATYTRDQLAEFFRNFCITDETTQGPFKRGNELAVSGSASPLTLATGACCVYGFLGFVTTAGDLTVSTPAVGTTGGHIVARADWSAQTVRIVAVRNTDGVNSTPSLTQTAGTTWEVRLYSFTITTTGTITLTDVRQFARWPGRLLYTNVEGMTATRVPFADANGRLTEDSGLTFDATNKTAQISGTTSAERLSLQNVSSYSNGTQRQAQLDFRAYAQDLGLRTSAIIRALITPINGISTPYAELAFLLADNSAGLLERARLTPVGLGIGDTTPDYALDVVGQVEISPASAAAPLVLGANAQGQRVAGLVAEPVGTLGLRRRGGDATNWSVAGTTNYTPGTTDGARIQCGSATTIHAGGTTATATVTFPTAFSAIPLIVAQVAVGGPTDPIVVETFTPSTTGFTVKTRTATGLGITESITINWIAIGPQ
jgi:hypothetical protein